MSHKYEVFNFSRAFSYHTRDLGKPDVGNPVNQWESLEEAIEFADEQAVENNEHLAVLSLLGRVKYDTNDKK